MIQQQANEELPDQTLTKKSDRRRMIERATIIGVGFSLGVHLIIMLIAALVTVDFGFADAGGNNDDDVDFAVMTNADLAQIRSPEIQHESFEVAAIEAESVRIDLLAETQSDDSVSELADSVAPSLNPGGGSLTSIDSTTGSAGAGTGDGASFFGLEAQGRRFAYIVDISGSMTTLTGDGAFSRWDLTRGELIRSVDGLDPQAQFTIVLYSSNAIAVFGDGGWVDASPGNKRLTAQTLLGRSPGGGTLPIEAFQLVYRLDPEPDAIYFMTDGLFDTEVPTQVRQLNRREMVPIHTILFGDLASQREALAAKTMMATIARNSGGKFTHIKDASP